MTDSPQKQNRRRWVICGTLAAVMGLAYVAAFALVLSQGRIEGDRKCIYLTDVSTLEGWKSHQRRARFFAPMFRSFSQLFGTDLPCSIQPDYGLEL
jgi:hypothetical protein